MSKEITEVITLFNGVKRKVIRWTTSNGEVNYIKDIETDKTYCEYDYYDIIRRMTKDFPENN